MKILLIYGEENAGKTTTCQKILDWLNARGWNQLSYEKIEDPADGWFDDFKVKGTFNGKTIAIYSPGDDRGHVRNAISFSHESPACDILVATIRKGIHYTQPLSSVTNSPQYVTTRFILKKVTSVAEKGRLEDEIVRQIVANF